MILFRVLLVPFIVMMVVFGTLIYYFAINLHREVRGELGYIAAGHSQLIEQFLRERSYDIQNAACVNNPEELSVDVQLREVFYEMQQRSSAILDLGLFDDQGDLISYIGPYNLQGKNYAQAEWFRQVQGKGIHISDVFLGYRNHPHFVIAVRKEESARAWYLRATIDTFFFNDLVEDIHVGKTGEAYLINREGVFQTRRRSGGNLMEIDPDHGSYKIEDNDIASFTANSQEGEKYHYAIQRLSSTGWLLVVRQELADAYAPLTHAILIGIGIILAGGAIVAFMAFVLASSVANQVTICDLEKRRMGCQLIMAGKLAEIGEMSAGVAHEINNPLQVIKGEEALMKDILDEIETDGAHDQSENFRLVRESIDSIALQVGRGKKITEGLLGFARKSEAKIGPTNIRQVIPKVVSMIEHRAQMENIRIVQEFESDLPLLQSDEAHLQQVFLNLFNNAIDALKEKGGGDIRIMTYRNGEDITVTVADSGSGIAPEHLEKIFLPFFTTKPVGQGTGLGLSTCYGIVENLGGKITVTSELNVGTVFTVCLPLASPSVGSDDWQKIHQKGGRKK